MQFLNDYIPWSNRFRDIYFSRENGLEESRHVFLLNGKLFDQYPAHSNFSIAEIGFGTGLNFLAALDLWRSKRPEHGWLTYFSVEKFPLTAVQSWRAVKRWEPELGVLIADLVTQWPPNRSGRHILQFEKFRATLVLWPGEALDGVKQLTEPIDSWFLDGFSPATNPDCWSEPLLERISALSAPQTQLMTFTVAGHIRRKLQAVGFKVQKRPGFGSKRHALFASFEPQGAVKPNIATCSRIEQKPQSNKRVAIIGSGIAGCLLSYFAQRYGMQPHIFDQQAKVAKQRDLPGALITPRFDLDTGGPSQSFHLASYFYAQRFYAKHFPQFLSSAPAFILRENYSDEKWTRLVQLFSPLRNWFDFDPHLPSTGLNLTRGAVLRSAALLSQLRATTATAFTETKISRLSKISNGWQLQTSQGKAFGAFDAVIIAVGAGLCAFSFIPGQEMHLLAGRLLQLGMNERGPFIEPLTLIGNSFVSLENGFLRFGASFDRFDNEQDAQEFLSSNARFLDKQNRQRCRTLLEHTRSDFANIAEYIDTGKDLSGWSGLRLATKDQTPICGPAINPDKLDIFYHQNRWRRIDPETLPIELHEPGLFLLAALGAHGFTLAPLLAHQIVHQLATGTDLLPPNFRRSVHPARFALRHLKRK